jgi:hypothetical protein
MSVDVESLQLRAGPKLQTPSKIRGALLTCLQQRNGDRTGTQVHKNGAITQLANRPRKPIDIACDVQLLQKRQHLLDGGGIGSIGGTRRNVCQLQQTVQCVEVHGRGCVNAR